MDPIGDEIKALVNVDEFDDGEGSKKKKNDLADACEVIAKKSETVFTRMFDVMKLEDPAADSHEQGDGGFIDAGVVFDGDQKISNDEEKRHEDDFKIH